MKWLQAAVGVTVILVLAGLASPSIVRAQAHTQTVTIPVQGMTWVGWERVVESAVSGLPGIIEVKASVREGNVILRYDPAAVTPAEMANVIVEKTYYLVGEPVAGGELAEGSGQAPIGSTVAIRVPSMIDEQTASSVIQAMGAVEPTIRFASQGPRILDVSADITQSTLTVRYDDVAISPGELLAAISDGTGLEASLATSASAETNGGVDYTPYVVLGVAALFLAALARPMFAWGRGQLAAPPRAERKRRRRRH